MKLVRLALAAAILVPACAAWAQHALEIIPLRYATVDQVLPALRPLLEPGATLTGQSNQLIVRASPGNVAELRRALEAIDRPRRRLQISVRFTDEQQAYEQGIAGSARIGERNARVEVQAGESRAGSAERVDQRVLVVEGGRARIATGQSRTLPQRQMIQTPAGVVAQDTFVVHETTTGFDVVPRVSGQRVLLDIAPQRQSPDGQGHAVATTVSAPLGEWFEIGGTDERASRNDRGIASARQSGFSASRKVWVKVEALSD